jgi:amino acid adenylation domain-containing protein
MSSRSRILIDRIERAATLHDEAPALRFGGHTLSYAELNARANQVANALPTWGARPGDLVAISMDRSPEMIVAMLGILKYGSGYVPVDPTYPPERTEHMLENCGASVLLSQASLRERFNDFQGNFIALNERKADLDKLSTADPGLVIEEPALGYVIYTSGSTGTPKGVALGRAALDNLIAWQLKNTEVLAGGRTAQFSPLSFDVSFQEIFATLCAGGCLVLIDEETRMDARRLLAFLATEQIERLFLPFIALQSLCEAASRENWAKLALREVITAGEQLQVTAAVRAFFERNSPCKLYNHYGPSETHVVTSHLLPGPPSNWPELPPIGRAIDRVHLYVLDEQRHPVATGAEGELYVGGVAVAEGYLGQADLTEERFLADPFDTAPDSRMYRTGDLVRDTAEGVLTFIGRRDGQIKVRGFRVELGEVEVALSALPGVAQAAVTAGRDRSGQTRLVAHVVPRSADEGGTNINVSSLRRGLVERLPEYMLPNAFVITDELPRTPSGKVDRRALTEPGHERPDLEQPYIAPTTPNERVICELWADLLGLDRVGSADDFFDLGGTSLVAVRFVSELRTHTGAELPIIELFERSTPAALARLLDHGKDSEDYLAAAQIQSKRRGSSDEQIAIVGLAGRFPGASDIEMLWEHLCQGKEGVRFFDETELDPVVGDERGDPAYVRARGILENPGGFDAAVFGLSPREAEILDPQQRLLLEAAWHALEDAGCDPARFERNHRRMGRRDEQRLLPGERLAAR